MSVLSAPVRKDDAQEMLAVEGIVRNGFALMGRVLPEIELQEPDMSDHRAVNAFFDSMKGKRVRLTIEAV